MRCKHCDTRLAPHDLWCVNCGKQTEIVNNDLSAWASLKRTWKHYWPLKSANVPAAAMVVLLGVFPLAVLLVLLRSFGMLDLAEVKTVGTLLLRQLMIVAGVTIFLPVFFTPFNPVCATTGYQFSWKTAVSSLRKYIKYLWLALFGALYYAVIYLICFGLPSFGSDPILRLVWLVLVNYFLAIVLPVPVLMERLQINFFQACKVSYRNFHVVRWQLYLLVLVLAVLNSLALVLLIIPLLVTIPFSWFAIRDYTDRLLEYELIRPRQ